MKDKFNYEKCMKRKCEECKYYDYCFKYKPKKKNEIENINKAGGGRWLMKKT